MAKTSKSRCRSFGTGWDIAVQECLWCAQDTPDEYEECARLTQGAKCGKNTSGEQANEHGESARIEPSPPEISATFIKKRNRGR